MLCLYCTYLITTGRSSSSRNHFSSLRDVISSTKIVVGLDLVGFGILFVLGTSGFSRVEVSLDGASVWNLIAVLEGKEGSALVGENEWHVETQKAKNNVEMRVIQVIMVVVFRSFDCCVESGG